MGLYVAAQSGQYSAATEVPLLAVCTLHDQILNSGILQVTGLLDDSLQMLATVTGLTSLQLSGAASVTPAGMYAAPQNESLQHTVSVHR